MRLVTSYEGMLQELTRAEADARAAGGAGFTTGLADWDALCPGGVWRSGAIHELLHSESCDVSAGSKGRIRPVARGSSPQPGEAVGAPVSHALLPGLLIARGALRADELAGRRGVLVWSDPSGAFFAPAAIAAGVPSDRLLVLRPRNVSDELWAVTECLRCPGVAAVVAAVGGLSLSRVWARRLQLAAERGGGAGVLIRREARAGVYAAASRWRVAPAVSDVATAQRWAVTLLHATASGLGDERPAVSIEVCRETNTVRAAPLLAARTTQTPAAAGPSLRIA